PVGRAEQRRALTGGAPFGGHAAGIDLVVAVVARRRREGLETRTLRCVPALARDSQTSVRRGRPPRKRRAPRRLGRVREGVLRRRYAAPRRRGLCRGADALGVSGFG